MDTASNSNSDSTNEIHICESHTQVTSDLDRSSEAGKGHNLSMTHDYTTAETERQLNERLTDLEKEVRICVCIYYSWMYMCVCAVQCMFCVMETIYIMLKFLLKGCLMTINSL